MLRFILIFCVALLSWKSNYAHKRYKGKAVYLQIEKWDNSEMAVGYSAFSIKDKFVWCGSAIRSKEDGKYYLFYSAMDSGENCPPFIDSWDRAVWVLAMQGGNFLITPLSLKSSNAPRVTRCSSLLTNI